MNGSENFRSAVNYISKNLKSILDKLPQEIIENTYEIRLRTQRPLSLTTKDGTVFVKKNSDISFRSDNAVLCTHEDVKDTFNRICSFSLHAFQKYINNGYIPMENGNRAGICGTAVCDRDAITSVKDVSSINIRISREVIGCADEFLLRTGIIGESFIIAGPPSSGKTTLIRDIVRQISSGWGGKYIRTALIDERREISGMIYGIPTNNIGITCDVLDSYPKCEAIDIAVRTLSPQVIVCDEVSTCSEIEAIKRGINCGAHFIVTVHAGSEEELYSRKQIEELLRTYSFSKIFLLGSGENTGKIVKVLEAGEIFNEITDRRYCGCDYFGSGYKEGDNSF